VGEPRDRLGLADRPPVLVDGRTCPDDLQRHQPSQLPVAGLVDHAEATATDLSHHLEVSDDRAGKERRRLGLALLRRGGDLPEEVGQRAGLHARCWTAAISGTFGHAHPPPGGSRLPDPGNRKP
jgi:hypothetical protein